MKRILLALTATIAVAVVGMSSASAVSTASAPRTNAAAVAHVKKILRYISNHQVVRMYKALAPKQHNLLAQKKFVKCISPQVKRIQNEKMTKLLAVRTSTRIRIPGYRGVHVFNKRVIFNRSIKQGGHVHNQSNVYADVAYLKGAYHWWLTATQIKACRSV
jgi:hypothetical protein